MMTRLEQFYRETVTKNLQEQFSYSSSMQIPRITKISINMGVGEGSQDKKVVDYAVNDLTLIAGQKNNPAAHAFHKPKNDRDHD